MNINRMLPGLLLVLTAPVISAEPVKEQGNATPSSEPHVTVIKGEQATIYEHRRSGGLYRAEVDPKYGKRYIFDDTDGDGTINDGDDEPGSTSTQMWNLFNW